MKSPRGALFHKYPPDVRALAWEYLNLLSIKYKAKLETSHPGYYAILVATATRLALDKLGYTQISRKGFHRIRIINRLKVAIGVMDKNPDPRYIPGYKAD